MSCPGRAADAVDRPRADDQSRVLGPDEATEGLAPRIVREIWQVIATIRATGIACVVVDRNYRAVLAHADRAVVLEKGQVVLDEAAPALAAAPARLDRYLGV